MMKITYLFIVLTFCISQTCLAVIYGEDSFLEVDKIEDSNIIHNVTAVAGIRNYYSDRNEINIDRYIGKRRLKHKSVCEYERFSNQVIGPEGTAFLIAPDLVMTVGHTIPSPKECQKKRSFIFNFTWDSENDRMNPIDKEDIYFCEQVLEFGYTPVDYAIVKLDRKVVGIEPVKLNFNPRKMKDRKIYTIGHTNMLPKKYSNGVMRNEDGPYYYKAALDAFRGNSGSPVFDAHTHEVIGILKGGEDDYEADMDNFCNKYKRCEEDKCKSESITKLSALPVKKIQKHIKLAPYDGDKLSPSEE